ncbi:MAG: thioesterase family protein [Sporolactobacillus sp.]
MFSSKTCLRVRYNETDKMGIVHHSQYVNWFEVARTDWVRQIGLSYRQVEEEGLMIPVIGITVNYHSPATYDDEIIIETQLIHYDSIKMTFAYTVSNSSNSRLLVDGTSTHCWTDLNMKPVSLRRRRPDLHKQLQERLN